MISDHEKFKNVLAGIQSLVVAVGIVIGGVWTAKVFDMTDQVRSSKELIEKTRQEVKVAKAAFEKAEKDLREKRVINISVNPSQVNIPGQEVRYIYAVVEITNVGNYLETLEWHGPAFRVRNIHFDERGTPKFGPPVGDIVTASTGESVGCHVQPGEVVRLPCLARVEGPGLYYLKFTASASSAKQKELAGEGLERLVEWSGGAFVVVP